MPSKNQVWELENHVIHTFNIPASNMSNDTNSTASSMLNASQRVSGESMMCAIPFHDYNELE